MKPIMMNSNKKSLNKKDMRELKSLEKRIRVLMNGKFIGYVDGVSEYKGDEWDGIATINSKAIKKKGSFDVGIHIKKLLKVKAKEFAKIANENHRKIEEALFFGEQGEKNLDRSPTGSWGGPTTMVNPWRLRGECEPLISFQGIEHFIGGNKGEKNA
jgi:hypothetical protein